MQLLLIGNWKMAPQKPAEAQKLARTALAISKKYKKFLSVVVCPPFIHIPTVTKVSKTLSVGAQTVAAEANVAQTGLVDAGMLRSSGVSYCIVGHSESRARGETNEEVAAKVLRLLEKKITPVICVGEKERDHQGWYLSVVKDQLESFLSLIPRAALKNIVIAYEPVWAIGSGAVREATPLECREMIIYIRKIITDVFGPKSGEIVRVIYGGSVDEKNALGFAVEGQAQGYLVGRVSLDSKRFSALAASIAK